MKRKATVRKSRKVQAEKAKPDSLHGVLCRAESELLEYLRQQFPATDGHIPLTDKTHAVWKAGWRSGMESAADIVLSRAEQLQRNNCKDTIREHYAEQAIRTAARHNRGAMRLGGETGRNSMKEKRVQRSQKRRAAKAQPSRASAIGSAYTMRLAALKGNIWDDIEDIDISEHFGLCDAFAAGAAKCLGLTKRTGWPTRIIFVCRPNEKLKNAGTRTPDVRES